MEIRFWAFPPAFRGCLFAWASLASRRKGSQPQFTNLMVYPEGVRVTSIFVNGPLESAVTRALAEVTVQTADAGVIELALTYAREIDAGGELQKLGPALLSVLESLLMTPKARAALVKGVKDVEPPKSPLDELRARRNARINDTKPMDEAAS